MNTKAILSFLDDIAKNNSREWFLANKARYDAVRGDFEDGVARAITRIAAFDLSAGHHASESSTTNILRNALRYDDTVSSSGPFPSPVAMSLRMFGIDDCVPCSLAYDLISRQTRAGSLETPSTREMSEFATAFTYSNAWSSATSPPRLMACGQPPRQIR